MAAFGLSVFSAFRDSSQRRAALQSPVGSAERYLLLGLDELRASGMSVRHNLEQPGPPPRWARVVGSATKSALQGAGGYGGDFATVLASLRAANAADVVFSTVDTVGIPLMLLKRAGRLKPPLVYVAIGLPERLAQLRGARMRRLYASGLRSVAAIVTYSQHEADDLRTWLGPQVGGDRVTFVPFGVDTRAFRPPRGGPTLEVVSVGADPHRDFDLLLGVAATLPHVAFRIIATADRVRTLTARAPENVVLESDLPFDEMRMRLERASVVALPVRENSYSGATTVLLQAMALGKPVVVSRTKAIASGYGLVDGENCRLAAPGDAEAFKCALLEVLRDERSARALGARARKLVERELTWERYVDRIASVVDGAVRVRQESPAI